MRRSAIRGAAVLAVMSIALAVPAGEALATDCWLLDSPALERAQAEGRCQDVFARSAPPAGDRAAAKPAPASTAKAARRKPAKATSPKAAGAQPTLAASLERFFGRYKPARGSAGRAPAGGIDHLAYGRTERNPVQR